MILLTISNTIFLKKQIVAFIDVFIDVFFDVNNKKNCSINSKVLIDKIFFCSIFILVCFLKCLSYKFCFQYFKIFVDYLKFKWDERNSREYFRWIFVTIFINVCNLLINRDWVDLYSLLIRKIMNSFLIYRCVYIVMSKLWYLNFRHMKSLFYDVNIRFNAKLKEIVILIFSLY